MGNIGMGETGAIFYIAHYGAKKRDIRPQDTCFLDTFR
jgi:hypothetical protein